MDFNGEKRDSNLEEELVLCGFCRTCMDKLSLQKHLPGCKKRYKGHKDLLMCPYNSSHYLPEHKYAEHVKKCKQDNGIKTSFDDFKSQISKLETNPEETVERRATATVSLPNEIQIKAFEFGRVRNFEAIWGLDKRQKKEWREAEHQRIENIKDGKPYDDIKYPRANGTYKTAREIIEKIRYGSIGNVRKPAKACSIDMSTEENSENAKIGYSRLQVSKKKKGEKEKEVTAPNETFRVTETCRGGSSGTSDNLSNINCTPGEQSGARKKTKNRKNQKEYRMESTGPNENSQIADTWSESSSRSSDNFSDFSCIPVEESGARKKTNKKWENQKEFTSDNLSDNYTPGEESVARKETIKSRIKREAVPSDLSFSKDASTVNLQIKCSESGNVDNQTNVWRRNEAVTSEAVSASRRSLDSDFPDILCERSFPLLTTPINKETSGNPTGARKKTTQRSKKRMDKEALIEKQNISGDSGLSCWGRKAAADAYSCDEASNLPEKLDEDVHASIDLNSHEGTFSYPSGARKKTTLKKGNLRKDKDSSENADGTEAPREGLNIQQSDKYKMRNGKKKGARLILAVAQCNQNLPSSASSDIKEDGFTEHSGAKKKIREKISEDKEF